MLKTNSIVGDLITSNRLLEILKDKVHASPFYEEDLLKKIITYTDSYLQFNEKEEVTADEAYFKFIKLYNKDMKAFVETGKYPLELNKNRSAPPRYEYDVILLFSCLFAAHRFRIMQLIQNNMSPIENCLFIGCGPGLEIELVKNQVSNLVAYDFSLDKFPICQHPEVNFVEEYFDGTNLKQEFDKIFLIELLEHLEKPYQLLKQCKNVLSNGGEVFLTTATNIPQFDHLYNFEADHINFERKVFEMGYQIELIEDIYHDGMTMDIEAKNRFYILSYQRKP